MLQSIQCRGFLSVIGSFFVTTSIGLMYLWGIISIYATSYYRLQSATHDEPPSLVYQQTDVVFPLMLLGQAITIPLTSKLLRNASPRTICMLLGLLLSFVLYLCSYITKFYYFALTFGLAVGLILGVIYIVPIALCLQYFPTKKTSVSGIIISASGVGTFILALQALNTINPDNVALGEGGYYGSEITQRFPQYLRSISIWMLILVCGGALLLFQYPSTKQQKSSGQKQTNLMDALINQQFTIPQAQKQEEQKNPFGSMMYEMVYLNKGYDNKMYKENHEGDREFWPSITLKERESSTHVPQPTIQPVPSSGTKLMETINECPRVRDAPKEGIFWTFFLCMMLSTNFGLLISCNYKNYIREQLDDQYTTFIGAFGALVCGVSRFMWVSFTSETASIRNILWLLLVVNCFLAFTIPYISEIKLFYTIYTVVAYTCYGGFLGIFPVLSTRIFGIRYGTQIYGLLFYAFPLSNFIQVILINLIEVHYGYWPVFMVSGGMGVCGFILLKAVTKTIIQGYDWSKRIHENNERKRLLVR